MNTNQSHRLLSALFLTTCLFPACSGGGGEGGEDPESPELSAITVEDQVIPAGKNQATMILDLSAAPHVDLALLQFEVVLQADVAELKSTGVKALGASKIAEGEVQGKGRTRVLVGTPGTTVPLANSRLVALTFDIVEPRVLGTSEIRFENIVASDPDGKMIDLLSSPITATLTVQ